MGQSTMDNTSETTAVFLAITQELLQDTLLSQPAKGTAPPSLKL